MAFLVFWILFRLKKIQSGEKPKQSIADIVNIQNLKAKAKADGGTPEPEGPSGRKLEHNISFQANVVDHALRPDTVVTT